VQAALAVVPRFALQALQAALQLQGRALMEEGLLPQEDDPPKAHRSRGARQASLLQRGRPVIQTFP
jgi:hypothetical protein